MVWIIVGVVAILFIGELVYFLSDKMPWHRKDNKYGER